MNTHHGNRPLGGGCASLIKRLLLLRWRRRLIISAADTNTKGARLSECLAASCQFDLGATVETSACNFEEIIGRRRRFGPSPALRTEPPPRPAPDVAD